MLTILILAVVAAGLVRVAGGARAFQVGILLGAVLLVAMRLIVDPASRPDMGVLAGWGQGGLYLALIAVPILGYAALIRGLRKRSGADKAFQPRHAAGLVLIEDDTALMADIASRHRAATPSDQGSEVFSVAHKEADGHVSAAGQAVLSFGLVVFRQIWVDPDRRGEGLGRKLIAALEDEAQTRGARRAAVETDIDVVRAFCKELGYHAHSRLEAPGGPARVTLVKDLS